MQRHLTQGHLLLLSTLEEEYVIGTISYFMSIKLKGCLGWTSIEHSCLCNQTNTVSLLYS